MDIKMQRQNLINSMTVETTATVQESKDDWTKDIIFPF